MLKNNEIYEAEITGYTSEGEGVARIDGEVVFIPGTIEGETCRFRIVNIGKTVAHGVLTEVVRPSDMRTELSCKYAERCGGCVFHHMKYEEELRQKAQRVLDALNRIGGQQLETVEITPSPSQCGYRNKAQYPVSTVKGKPAAGFYQKRTHRVIPVENCGIEMETAEQVRRITVKWMNQYKIPAYDEQTGKGLVRHIYVRTGKVSGQVLACIVINGENAPKERELTEALRTGVPGLETVVLSINTKKGNTVLGNRFRTLYGNGTIEDVLCGYTFRLSPQSFYQINHDQAEQLYDCAVEFAGLSRENTVLDLYCGTGTITLCLAKRAGSAIGVEVVESAIHDAKENARRNGVENVRFFCADAGEAATQLAAEGTRPDVIVVDPPRKGLSADVIEAMVKMTPEKIVYVSCDPATLARDVKLLAGEYTLQKVKAFDMFPRCAHVETVCLMSRKEK